MKEIVSDAFSPEETLLLANELGIKVRKALELPSIEKKVKSLYGKKIESLIVEVEVVDKSLRVRLMGSRQRVLRRLIFKNLEESISREAAERTGVTEGVRIDSRSLISMQAQIKLFLQGMGYFHAETHLSVNDIGKASDASDVLVNVERGEPTKIGTIKIEGLPDEDVRDLFQLIEIKRGLPLKQSDLEKTTEIINRYLKENQYAMAKIEFINPVFSDNRYSADVVIAIKSGRKLQLQFIGNSVFDDLSLRDLITVEMLTEVDSHRQVASAIERKYRDVGYHFCRVAISDGEKGASLIRSIKIDEGAKVRIDSLKVVGSSDLGFVEEMFFDGAPGVLQRKVFWEPGLEEASRNLENSLIERGFLKARVSTVKPVFSADLRGVQLFLEVEIGPQTFVHQMEVVGNQTFTGKEIEIITELGGGVGYSPQRLEAAKSKLSEFYKEKGFVDSRINMTEKQLGPMEGARVNVSVEINEGIRYHVGDVTIQGNAKTDPDVILAEMKLKKGDVYVPSLERKSEENINLLGIFSKVEVVSHSSLTSPRSKDIKIAVTESRPGVGEVGVGAAYEDPTFRLRSFFGVAYRNLFGRNHTVSFRGEVAVPMSRVRMAPFVEYATVVGLRSPSPWRLPFVFTGQLGADRFELDPTAQTLQNRARLEERIEKKMSDVTTIYYRLHRYERTSIENWTLPSESQSPADVIGSTGPGIAIDWRDNIFNPTRGSFHTVDIEYAVPALLSNDNIRFIMALNRNSFYFPLVGTRLGMFLGLGYIRTLDESVSLPKARLGNEMAMGGHASIRGFAPRSIKAIETALDAAFINLRTELAFPIFGELGGAVFVDTGQIFANLGFSDRKIPTTRQDGFGFGIRYKTPVGPFVIDFAHGVGDSESVRFYFTLGSI